MTGVAREVALARSHGGRASSNKRQQVVLVVNRSERRASVRLSVPPLAGKKIHVWHERRTLAADAAGMFADELEPFAVRVYADREQ